MRGICGAQRSSPSLNMSPQLHHRVPSLWRQRLDLCRGQAHDVKQDRFSLIKVIIQRKGRWEPSGCGRSVAGRCGCCRVRQGMMWEVGWWKGTLAAAGVWEVESVAVAVEQQLPPRLRLPVLLQPIARPTREATLAVAPEGAELDVKAVADDAAVAEFLCRGVPAPQMGAKVMAAVLVVEALITAVECSSCPSVGRHQ